MLASISVSLSLGRSGLFPSLSLRRPPRLLACAHTNAIFLPLRSRAGCLRSTERASRAFTLPVSLSLSSFFRLAPSPLISLQYCRGYAQSLAHTIPRHPSVPPASLVLISVLGRRACTQTGYLRRSLVYTRELSLSLLRANTDTAPARERCGEKQGEAMGERKPEGTGEREGERRER